MSSSAASRLMSLPGADLHARHAAGTAGPLEIHRYRFTARVAGSLFSDRDVIFLDHDTPANPPYIRRFHDELVMIEDGLYLATSHYRTCNELRYLCHFALAKPGA